MSPDDAGAKVREHGDAPSEPGSGGAHRVEVEPLDDAELALVEAGLGGMRVLDEAERRFVEQSRDAAEDRRWRWWAFRVALTFMAVLVVGAGAAALVFRRQGGYRAGMAKALEARAAMGRPGQEMHALVSALDAVRLTDGDEAAQRAALESLSGAVAGAYRTRRFVGPTKSVEAVAFAPDSAHVAGGGDDGDLYVWELRGSNVQKVALGEPIWGIAYAPNGSRLAVATGADEGPGRVHLLEVPSFRELRAWDAHGGKALSVAFSPDSSILVSGGADDVAVWSSDGALSTRFASTVSGALSPVWSVAFAVDGDVIRFASTNCDGGILLRAFPASLERTLGDGKVRELVHGDRGGVMRSVVFSGDGTALVTSGWSHGLAVWDARTGDKKWQRETPGVSGAVFTHDGAIASGGWDKALTIRSVERAGEPIETLRDVSEIVTFAASPDGKWVAAASWDHSLHVWSEEPPGVAVHLPGDAVANITVSRDGKRMVTIQRDEGATIWDATAQVPTLIAKFKLDAPLVYAELAPDDDTLLTVNARSEGQIWSAAKPAAPIARLPGSLDFATFSLRGDALAVTRLMGGVKARILSLTGSATITRDDVVPDDEGYYASARAPNRLKAT